VSSEDLKFTLSYLKSARRNLLV